MSLYLYIAGTVLAYCLWVRERDHTQIERITAVGLSLTWPVSLPILMLIAMVQS